MIRRLQAAAIVLVLLATNQSGRATTVIPPTFDELVARAATIVRGQVVDVRSEWRDSRSDRTIVTLVTFTVDSVVKGPASIQILLEFMGGTVDDVTLRIAGMPQFRVGDRDILFVSDAGRPVSPIVGFAFGRFPVRRDVFTGREFVTTYDGRAFASTAEIGQPNRTAAARGFPRAGPSVSLSVADFETLIRRKIQDQASKR